MIETRDPLPGFEERLLAELLELVGDRDAPERRRRRRPMRRRWTFAAAAAAALAIGIGLPTALPTGSPGGPDPAAAAALHRLSDVALDQAATTSPKAGQFVYTRSSYTQLMWVGSDGPGGDYRYVETASRRAWISPDGSGRLVEVEGDTSFPTAADEAAWRADGAPNLGGGSGSDETYDAGGLYFQDVSRFSPDPDRLRSQLEALADDRHESVFEAAGELLRETYAPPDLRAAILNVVSNLPDVRYLGHVTDAAGRPGVGFAFTEDERTQEMIFDRDSSALLGESSFGDVAAPEAGAAYGTRWSTAYLESDVVNTIGPDSILGAGPRHYCTTTGPYTSRCDE
jgi:hypothetical protein